MAFPSSSPGARRPAGSSSSSPAAPPRSFSFAPPLSPPAPSDPPNSSGGPGPGQESVLLIFRWAEILTFYRKNILSLMMLRTKTYTSGFGLLGLPHGDVGGNGGGLWGAHGRFGPGRNDAHWIERHCWDRDGRDDVTSTIAHTASGWLLIQHG